MGRWMIQRSLQVAEWFTSFAMKGLVRLSREQDIKRDCFCTFGTILTLYGALLGILIRGYKK